MAPCPPRAYQACSSGLVVASMKYGRPTLAASSPRMRRLGSASPIGFQLASGRIGNAAMPAASRARWTSVCVRGLSARIDQCEYA